MESDRNVAKYCTPILQRTTVGIGQIKIQAVATCLFLCMDTCGSVYGSVEISHACFGFRATKESRPAGWSVGRLFGTLSASLQGPKVHPS
uniref:Uncharacterized protein n=1 Tax=Anopheles quadriannulatus TaxID=34691 RepID=A0A182XJ50_ANOQN